MLNHLKFSLSPRRVLLTMLFLSAALLELLALPALFHQDFALGTVLRMGITEPNAIRFWMQAGYVCSVLGVLIPGFLAICFAMSMVTTRAYSVLSITLKGLIFFIRGLRIFLAVLFVYKATRYIIRCLPQNLVVQLIFSMLLFEGFLAICMFLFLHHFLIWLQSGVDALDTLAYCAVSNSPEPEGISHLLFIALRITGFFFLVLALLRLSVLLSFFSFFLSAVGFFCLGSFLRRKKLTMEQQKHSLR